MGASGLIPLGLVSPRYAKLGKYMTVAAVVVSFDRLRPLWATRIFASKCSVRGGQPVNFLERLQPLTFHLCVAQDGKRCLIAVVRGLYEGVSSSPGIVIQAS